MNHRTIIKYLLFAIVVGFVLRSVPNLYDDGDKTSIVMHTILATLAFVVIDKYFIHKESFDENQGRPTYPGMSELVSEDTSNNCDPAYKEPCPYQYSVEDQDYLNTGIKYDHNKPGYYLLCNGEYSNEGVSYDQIDEMICKSKLHTLKHQHNYNVEWSPHTHIGKARGFLNPDKTIENVQ